MRAGSVLDEGLRCCPTCGLLANRDHDFHVVAPLVALALVPGATGPEDWRRVLGRMMRREGQYADVVIFPDSALRWEMDVLSARLLHFAAATVREAAVA